MKNYEDSQQTLSNAIFVHCEKYLLSDVFHKKWQHPNLCGNTDHSNWFVEWSKPLFCAYYDTFKTISSLSSEEIR